MSDDLKPKISLGSALAKGTISQLPVLGPIFTELISQAIPDKRVVRLEGLFERLEQRVANLEPATVRDRFAEPEFIDLVEDAMFSATRASSDDRLTYIAEIVARGLTRGDLQRIDRRYLLALLGQLNDVEVLILCSKAMDLTPKDRDKFWEQHRDALFADPPTFGEKDPEKHIRHAIQESYETHMEGLGLVQRQYHPPRAGDRTEFGSDGRLKGHSWFDLTSLGWALLREIGQHNVFEEPNE